MPRIKIEDLPVLEDLKEEEVRGLFGGQTINFDASLTLQQEFIYKGSSTSSSAGQGNGRKTVRAHDFMNM